MKRSDLYKGCRSYRRFRQDPIPEELWDEIMENLRNANSGRNKQTLHFYLLKSPEVVAKMQSMVHWAASLPKEIGTPRREEQPVGFVVIAIEPGSTPVVDIDVGISAHVITTTAYEAGFGSCILGALNLKQIAELIHLPEDCTIRLAVALGKPGCTSTIVDPPADGNIDYYVDADRNYYVPKRKIEEIITVL